MPHKKSRKQLKQMKLDRLKNEVISQPNSGKTTFSWLVGKLGIFSLTSLSMISGSNSEELNKYFTDSTGSTTYQVNLSGGHFF